ncbi:FAD/NAD(P)-binding oxidoreductase family protein [Trifolium repens]|nr:FAD/NAD(P)-binding oxidoreductase family protein [Trifolium repens]
MDLDIVILIYKILFYVQIPVKGFSIKNSKVLRWAYCDSKKPGRSTTSERWVLHSTAEYAENIIAQMGLKKPSDVTLRARLNFSNFSEMGHI